MACGHAPCHLPRTEAGNVGEALTARGLGKASLLQMFSSVHSILQDKRAVERLEVEKAFHPFIAGPYNRLVGEIMQETGTRINIPPPSVNRTEIVFTGEKEQLAQAVARIKKIYEEKVQCDGGRAQHLSVGIWLIPQFTLHPFALGHKAWYVPT